jgi:hypothetical protein
MIYCKNFCKCHNVPQHNNNKNKLSKKKKKDWKRSIARGRLCSMWDHWEALQMKIGQRREYGERGQLWQIEDNICRNFLYAIKRNK